MSDIPKTPDDFTCSHCGDEHYLLQGCCDGRECGCMGQPVAVSVCTNCNADGKKQAQSNLKYSTAYRAAIDKGLLMD